MEPGRLSSRYKGPHPSSLLAVKSSKVRDRECLVSLSSFPDFLLTEAGLVWAQLRKVSIVCNCISCVVSRMTFYSSSLCLLGRAYFLPLLQRSPSLRGASLNILSGPGPATIAYALHSGLSGPSPLPAAHCKKLL